MSLPSLLIILIILNNSLQDCIIDNRIPEDAWEQQLHKDLQKYKYQPPTVTNSSHYKVDIRFIMKYFEFDSNEQMFRVFSWVVLKWCHDKLTWNPDDYGGLNETMILSMDMWIPSVKLINGLTIDELDHLFNVPCEVTSKGNIKCIPRFDDVAICSTVLTNWPYDTQKCSLEFGAKCSQQNMKMRLSFLGRAITMIGADYGAEWDIMDYEQELNQDAEVQLKMTFTLERHADGLSAILIYPATVLTIISITCLILDPRTRIRLWLICYNLMNHFIFLLEIQEQLPKNSFDVPIILMYYRGSLIVTILIVLLTFALNAVCKREVDLPAWISSFIDFVFNTPLKYVVLPRWICNDAVTKNFELWTNLANIFNTICLFVIIVTYICLYFVYMPQPLPIEN